MFFYSAANRYRKLMESHTFKNIEVLHITSLKISTAVMS